MEKRTRRQSSYVSIRSGARLASLTEKRLRALLEVGAISSVELRSGRRVILRKHLLELLPTNNGKAPAEARTRAYEKTG